MVDYYNLLQVAPDAPPEALRAAYRREAKRWHPDVHPHLNGPEREAMQRRFILLSQAYDTLSDPARRRDYDRQHGPIPASRQASTRGAAASKAKPSHAGTGSGAGAARPRSEGAGTRGDTAREPDWNSLLSEVESLLGKFGLVLKQPAERLLETLLDWARALFDDFLATWNGEGPQVAPRADAKNSPFTSSEGRESAARAHPSGPAHRDKTRTPEIDAELAELKRRAGKDRDGTPKG